MYLKRFKDTFRIHAGYMQDTLKINQRYMRDKCIWKGNQDTFRIHPGYMMRYMYLIMYLERYVSEMQDTCGIHAGYMYLQG